MKKGLLKIVLLLLIVTNLSCDNDDDCNDSNREVDFPIKVKLVSESGSNLLSDNDFDVSLLKITDPSNSIVSLDFTQVIEDGEEIIIFQGINMNSVNFVYDEENEFFFGIHDVKLQTINCAISVSSFQAKKLNGDLICDCNRNELLVITLDL